MDKKSSVIMIISSLLYCFILIGIVGPVTVGATNESGTLPFLKEHVSGPFDVGLVNHDKILQGLIEQGLIDKKASAKTQEKKLNDYIENRAKNAEKQATDQQDQKKVRQNIQQAAALEEKPAVLPDLQEQSLAKPSNKGITSIEKETWDGAVQTDEILVLLIDFPDYQNSNITEADQPVLLYDTYPKEHYQSMIFGSETYKGGNGEDFISMKAFYEQQSGGSYTLSGQVSDWYTADHPAAYYGGNYPTADGNDSRPRELVKEALEHAAQDPAINLADFDKEDIYDLDGDGDYREPDGMIDHLMIVHAGTGEEAGGGVLGADAIWSHSWSLDEAPFIIPNTEGTTEVPYWGGSIGAFDYTIQPEDGAAGVFAHEYGHDLGLPDSYDTNYTANGVGAPTDYWTIMASGSWAGIIPGTEPTGFSPYDKEFLQDRMPDSNWFKDVEYDIADIKAKNNMINLDQASVKGTNADAVKLTLPDKRTAINVPTSGNYEYFSGSGNDLNNHLSTTIDLTNVTEASFQFNAYYDIEVDWDYGSVQVNDGSGWKSIAGNITTESDPNGQNPGHGITGTSDGWIEARFDLTDYVGKQIGLRINYWTDVAVSNPGLYVDDLQVIADESVVIEDGAEAEPIFELDGFSKSDGNLTSDHYYLIEWRNHAAADRALGRITRGNSVMTLDPGMVVWYVDKKYDDNWVGDHPGDGFLGVIDAHQETAVWSDGTPAVTRYQIQDAAFSLSSTDEMFLDFLDINGTSLSMLAQPAVATFNDANDYSNPGQVYAGRNVLPYGLGISVVEQAEDWTTAQIELSYDARKPNVSFEGLESIYSSNPGYNNMELTITASDGNLQEEITVTTTIIDDTTTAVMEDTQSFITKREEEKIPVKLEIPKNLATGMYTLVVEVSDGINKEKEEATFEIDNDAPAIDVDHNGNSNSEKEATVTVNIDGAEEESLQYVWSNETDIPNEGWVSFKNGSKLSLSNRDGNWYLYVKADDGFGNELIWKSDAFLLDNTKPEIILQGDNPIVLQAGDPYQEPGYEAMDEADGELTDQVAVTGEVDSSKLGEYRLTYTVLDSAGNQATIDRVVHVVDDEAPYISLEGDYLLEIEVGTPYKDPGFIAEDNLDGDITDLVTVNGEVDTSVVGDYILSYIVSDTNGHTFETQRIIRVIDSEAPIITLSGDSTVVLEYGDPYEEPGFEAVDNYDGDVTRQVEVASDLDLNTIGVYNVRYRVLDAAGNETFIERAVHVIDTKAPTIELLGEDPVVIEAGHSYLEAGFTATDNYDGDLTNKVVVTRESMLEVGDYPIVYKVVDSSGNETTITRTVTAVDTTAPSMVLKGDNPYVLKMGEPYEELGFKAMDRGTIDLTDQVEVTGELDVNKIGKYTVTYTVSDKYGNTTSVDRIVIVNEKNKVVTDQEKDKAVDAIPPQGKQEEVASGVLPSTATNIFNLIGLGFVVLLIGTMVYIIQRKRKIRE